MWLTWREATERATGRIEQVAVATIALDGDGLGEPRTGGHRRQQRPEERDRFAPNARGEREDGDGHRGGLDQKNRNSAFAIQTGGFDLIELAASPR